MNTAADRRTAVVAPLITTTVLAAFYLMSRSGFENPVLPVITTAGFSFFLVASPYYLSALLRRKFDSRWWSSEPVAALFLISVTSIIGLLDTRSGLLFATAGFTAGAVTVLRWLREASLKATAAFTAGAIVFSVWCAGVIWGSRYKMPLFWERLSFNSNIHHDPFYYASMANMIETYGVPSTGLDGLPVIRYHFGSPWLFAQWSDVLGMDVLSFYSLGYPLIVLPLFLYALVSLSLDLRSMTGAQGSRSLRSDWRIWLVFLGATVGFIPTAALDALAVRNSNAFISESHLIGMPVFFFMMSSAIAFYRSDSWDKFAAAPAVVFLILFVPIVVAGLGFLKISLMILAVALAVYVVFRLRLYRNPVVVGSILLSAMVAGLTYRIVSFPEHNTGISLFHFMRYYAAAGWQQFFPLIHLLWTWAYIAARLWEERVRTFGDLWAAGKSGRILDVEVVTLVAIVGFLPGELISIHGGSAVYFSDVQRWLSLSFIMARLGMWVRDRAPLPEAQRALRGLKLSTVLAVFIAAPFAATLLMNLALWPRRVVRANVALRRDAAQHGLPYLPIVAALREISQLSKNERARSVLFIPKSSTSYWSMFTADGRCTFTPLIAPAVASVAMIDGMPPADCTVTDQYNMTVYRRWTAGFESATDDAALCARSRQEGFSRVIVLDAPPGKNPHRRAIDC